MTTNTNTAIYPVAHKRCPRHRRIAQALERIGAGDRKLSVGTFAEILSSVATTTGPSETMYSNVFDLTNGLATLYHRHDFERPAVLDVAALEAAGERAAYPIAELLIDPDA